MRNQLGQIQVMQNQMNQMTVAINRLESQVYEKLPSQPELNLKNVSVMTLRSGKEIQEPDLMIPKDKDEKKIENELEKENTSTKNQVVLPDPIIDVKTNLPLFPSRLEKLKKQDKKKEILEVFRKVEINIPLLDTIKQVPKYAKFLRDLCVNRRQLRGDERIIVGENVSAVLRRKLPPKCGDLVINVRVFHYYCLPCSLLEALATGSLLGAFFEFLGAIIGPLNTYGGDLDLFTSALPPPTPRAEDWHQLRTQVENLEV
ncbi:uncharacterized protein [Coffea arabica]|uniref:Uncharacterized protein n=1 Tax=Coffea arabica TaxID=13443 RepID=A0ABM4VH17_COFAR